MKRHLISGIVFLCFSICTYGQANQELDNLNPTAVNLSLVPGADSSIDLGTLFKRWKTIYLGQSLYLDGTIFMHNGTRLGGSANNTFLGREAGLRDIGSGANVGIGYRSMMNNTTGANNTAIGVEALHSNSTGGANVAVGFAALHRNLAGEGNVAVGHGALYLNNGFNNVSAGFETMSLNTTGSYNVATGSHALQYNTTGNSNVAIGAAALRVDSINSNIVAIGDSALMNNGFRASSSTDGTYNTAVGSKALYANTIGYNNTATGYQSLYSNITGLSNTANGSRALFSNTTGSQNTGSGLNSLSKNTTGDNNTAYGFQALVNNSTGSENTAQGNTSLNANTTGKYNTGVGSYSLYYNSTGSKNTAIGFSAGDYTYGASQSTFLGARTKAKPGLFNATAVGYGTIAKASNQVMLGNTAVTSVWAAGHFVIYSDGRFKRDINEDVPGLAFINKLRPVTYHYNIHDLNKYIDPVSSNTDKQRDEGNEGGNTEARQKEEDAIKAKEQKLYTGFIAQEVEKAANTLNYDFSGVYKPANDKDVYGLSYSDFVVPLVKSVQELSKVNEELNSDIRELKAEMEKLKSIVSSNSKEQVIPTKLSDAALDQNTPNPFNNTTTINYRLPQQYLSAHVIIFDNTGETRKQVIVSGHGKGSILIDASTFTSGAYSYSLYVDGKLIGTKQMILVK